MGTSGAATCLIASFLFGIVLAVILMAYEDGVPFGLFRRIKCKLGKHTHRVGYYKHVHKYYCVRCKAPRKSPSLTVINGGRKDFENTFKF